MSLVSLSWPMNESRVLATPAVQGALGVFGGTFDPLHIAHLRLAIEAREALLLTSVVFVPAGNPPLREAPQASPQQRLAMVARVLAGVSGFALDATEVVTRSPSYTVTTLERLRAQHGAARPLVLLMGADAFARLPAWHRWQELLHLAHIGVATRPGQPAALLPATALARQSDNTITTDAEKKPQMLGADDTVDRVEVHLADVLTERFGRPADISSAPAGRIVPFTITPLAISATMIRQRLAQGLSVRHLVPDTVLDYIETHSIY